MPNPENIEAHKWQPGQSGNPAGMKPGTQHSSTRLRRLLDAVQKAKNPVTKQEEDFTTLELMDAALIARALKGDVIAYREILDRVEGKTAQPIEHSGIPEQQQQILVNIAYRHPNATTSGEKDQESRQVAKPKKSKG